MNAKVSFVVGTADDCFAAPNGLIFRDGERRWILTRTWDGRFVEIPVQTGLETRRMTEIISDALYEGMELFHSR
jgi:sugar lactone lactonase YvrE